MKDSQKPCQHTLSDDVVYKEVVVIGNGPSGMVTSFMLAGNVPYLRKVPADLPIDDMLRARLENIPEGQSLYEADLTELAEGLEGRSQNPIPLLMDNLLRPCADLGIQADSLIEWKYDVEKQIDHIVLGRGPPGGAWHTFPPSVLTLSPAGWLSLPPHAPEGGGRLPARAVANYCRRYVQKCKIQRYFRSGVIVSGVSPAPRAAAPPCAGAACPNNARFLVSGYDKSCGRPFRIACRRVVVACGAGDRPNTLAPAVAPHALHSLSALQRALPTVPDAQGTWSCGAGARPNTLAPAVAPHALHSLSALQRALPTVPDAQGTWSCGAGARPNTLAPAVAPHALHSLSALQRALPTVPDAQGTWSCGAGARPNTLAPAVAPHALHSLSALQRALPTVPDAQGTWSCGAGARPNTLAPAVAPHALHSLSALQRALPTVPDAQGTWSCGAGARPNTLAPAVAPHALHSLSALQRALPTVPDAQGTWSCGAGARPNTLAPAVAPHALHSLSALQRALPTVPDAQGTWSCGAGARPNTLAPAVAPHALHSLSALQRALPTVPDAQGTWSCGAGARPNTLAPAVAPHALHSLSALQRALPTVPDAQGTWSCGAGARPNTLAPAVAPHALHSLSALQRALPTVPDAQGTWSCGAGARPNTLAPAVAPHALHSLSALQRALPTVPDAQGTWSCGAGARPNTLAPAVAPHALHSLSALQRALPTVPDAQEPPLALVVGSGVSAADAVWLCLRAGLRVAHAHRDPAPALARLDPAAYPDYCQVYKMMMDGPTGSHKNYTPYPHHKIADVTPHKNKKSPKMADELDEECLKTVKLLNVVTNDLVEITVSVITVLIGSKPDLFFLQTNFNLNCIDVNDCIKCTDESKHAAKRKIEDNRCFFKNHWHYFKSVLGQSIQSCKSRYLNYTEVNGNDTTCIVPDCNKRECKCEVMPYSDPLENKIKCQCQPSNPYSSGIGFGIDPKKGVDCRGNPVAIDKSTHEMLYAPKGMYALGPLTADNFVRFIPGGALALVAHIHKEHKSE